jgi:hypothetical protein
LQIPKISKNDEGHYKNLKHGLVQADLQFWNRNGENNYLLVVVDIVSKRVDFEAIADKNNETIINGMEAIFKRKYIFDHDDDTVVLPLSIQTDAGSEFGKVFDEWCTKHGIRHLVSRAGRKNQSAVVEAFNYVISRILAVKTTIEQNNDKRKGKHTQRQWVRYLPQLRTVTNDKEIKEKTVTSFFKLAKTNPKQLDLKYNDEVFVKLEKPTDINDNRLSGKFRIGDFRFTKTAHRITGRIYNFSGNPVRYMVEGFPNNLFMRSELIKK